MFNELIKNFEKIRAYMREFYLYGLKSREEYDKKSVRSYDDERRRIESWLNGYVGFTRTAKGKNLFISIDSRGVEHNPLYKAWKAKSFTDGDITLHFIIFDLLSGGESLSLNQIIQGVDARLSTFEFPMTFDESTVRKKLKEYCDEGLVERIKEGKSIVYKSAKSIDLLPFTDVIDFYSEIAPCGVVGSFLLDKIPENKSLFRFKHHYITGAMDSGVLATVFDAMREKRGLSIVKATKRTGEEKEVNVVPLRVFISVQNGRQHLIAYEPCSNSLKSLRIDYIEKVKKTEVSPRFDELRNCLDQMQENTWGVSLTGKKLLSKQTESVEFIVKIEDDELYIINRLEREKRNGKVEKIDKNTYRYTANVYDSYELVPWIRTFICRIQTLKFSNKRIEAEFKKDISTLYSIYGLKKESGV